MKRLRIPLRAFVIALAVGCRISVDAAGEPDPAPGARREGIAAADTLRVVCPAGGDAAVPALAPVGSIPLPGPASRGLVLDGAVLVALDDGGIGRIEGGVYAPLLPDGRDYAAAGPELLRLEEDRIEAYRLAPDGEVRRVREVPAGERDASIAVAGGALFVHSPFYEGDLLERRRLADGAVEDRLLPVERNLALALLTDPARLLEDTAIVRGDARRLAFVPRIRDPVAILDVPTGRWTVLALAGGERGEVRVEELETEEEQACPDCVRRVRKRARRTIRRLYAGAALDGDALWLLRLSPPGSRDAALIRVDLGGVVPTARTWRPAGLANPPRTIVRHEERIVVAGEEAIRIYPAPDPATGSACVVSEG